MCSTLITSVKEVLFVCLSVHLFVSRIMEKQSLWKLVEGWAKENPITFWTEPNLGTDKHIIFAFVKGIK